MGNAPCSTPDWEQITYCYKQRGNSNNWTCYHDAFCYEQTKEFAKKEIGPDLVGSNSLLFPTITPMWIRTLYLRYIHLPRPVGKITNVYWRNY